MDAASNVNRRNVLAGHLREVIDTLEQKVTLSILLLLSSLILFVLREIK